MGSGVAAAGKGRGGQQEGPVRRGAEQPAGDVAEAGVGLCLFVVVVGMGQEERKGRWNK